MEQGYVLTRHFYDELTRFEREANGLRDALPDWLFQMDLASEKKRAKDIVFAAQATPDPLRQANGRKSQLDLAEERLAERDADGAHRIAQKVLDDQSDDPARAMFILAKAATLNKDIDGARLLFERTLQVAKEPRTVAWSHILLARILDLMCDRDNAVSHYRAALSSGDSAPDTQAAANRGIQQTAPGCDKTEAEKSN
jgi:tetratricopeptide (TPR) repeat protein